MSPIMAWNLKLEMTISALHNIMMFIFNNQVIWRCLPSYEELREKLRRAIYLLLAGTVKLLHLSQHKHCDHSVKSQCTKGSQIYRTLVRSLN